MKRAAPQNKILLVILTTVMTVSLCLTPQPARAGALKDFAKDIGEAFAIGSVVTWLGIARTVRSGTAVGLIANLATAQSDEFNRKIDEINRIKGETEDPKTDEYVGRLWGAYMNDPQIISRIQPELMAAAQLVNQACRNKKWRCYINPNTVFLSEIPKPEYVYMPNNVVYWLIPADVFIKPNSVEIIAHQLAEMSVWVQMPSRGQEIRDQFNADGSKRSMLAKIFDEATDPSSKLPFAMAAKRVANELLSSVLPNQNSSAKAPSTAAYYEVYHKGFMAYRDQLTQNLTIESFGKNFLSFRVIHTQKLAQKDDFVLAPCGVDGVEKLFGHPLAPCRRIALDEIADAKLMQTVQDAFEADQKNRDFEMRATNFAKNQTATMSGLLMGLAVDVMVGKKLQAIGRGINTGWFRGWIVGPGVRFVVDSFAFAVGDVSSRLLINERIFEVKTGQDSSGAQTLAGLMLAYRQHQTRGTLKDQDPHYVKTHIDDFELTHDKSVIDIVEKVAPRQPRL